jgi:hypothetical protein
MSLSSKEAEESLADVENAARRSARIYGYSRAAPHLILWGAIWVIGYGATDLRPMYANLIWGVLIPIGCVGSFLFSRRCANTERTTGAWRVFALAGLALLFIFSTYTIMWPLHGHQFGAYPALLTGVVYSGVGLWLGARWVVTGLAVTLLTLGGFFLLREHYLLWMAFVGGGSMILAGFWFRTV